MSQRLRRIAIALSGLAVAIVLAFVTRPYWQPIAERMTSRGPRAAKPGDRDWETGPAHAGHDHGVEAASGKLMLSDQAQKNLGLEFQTISLQDDWQAASMPGEVTEEPGHCEQGVSATVYGVILKIHAFLGQTVRAGDPLFDIQLTGELLATSQSSLLKTLQEIELVQLELKRLAPSVESGAIPAARRIEKEYELKRLESKQLVQSQDLLVRGLVPEQIEQIVATKTLLRRLTIRVPAGSTDGDDASPSPEPPSADAARDAAHSKVKLPPAPHEHGSVYSVEELNVHLGKLVKPGDELCHLARHSQLLISGRAFERESHLVSRAVEQNWPVTAIFDTGDSTPLTRTGLSILYIDNAIDADSRTLRFYVPLANEILRDSPAANGLAYRSWRFKPGQQVRLLLPTVHHQKQIVLPADAIVSDGGNSYVFRANGKLLERTAVIVERLDSRQAVLKNDGTLTPGFDVVAKNQAYQLNLELKKKSGEGGGGHDHHGHEH